MIRKQKDRTREMDKTSFVLFSFSSLAICLHSCPPTFHNLLPLLLQPSISPWWPLAPGSSLLVSSCVRTSTVRVQKWECEWGKVCILWANVLFLLTLVKGWPKVRAIYKTPSSSLIFLFLLCTQHSTAFKPYNKGIRGYLIWHNVLLIKFDYYKIT